MTDEERPQPAAENVTVKFDDGNTPVPIETTGVALFAEGVHEPRISLRVTNDDAGGIQLILSPEDATALQDELQAAIEDAHEDAERFNQGDR